VINGLLHFGITCSDADRSLAFYRDLFGMRLVADRVVPRGGFVEKVTGVAGAEVRLVHLQGYGVNVELIQYLNPPGERHARRFEDAGSAHLCFTAENLDDVHARLREMDVVLRSSPTTVVGGPNDGGKGLYIEDPDGNGVEIVELARPWPDSGTTAQVTKEKES
jgi:catechol 2,3-dioxygenase-like lactoylglutathione lyase family enzyme